MNKLYKLELGRTHFLIGMAVLLFLLCVVSMNKNLFQPSPVILSASPEVVVAEYPDTWEITISGSNFKEDSTLYINGEEAGAPEFVDEYTVTYSLSEPYIEGVSEVSLQIRNSSGGKSNRYLLQIQTVPTPVIESVTVDSKTETYAMTTIKGTNIPASPLVKVNGVDQLESVLLDETTVGFKLNFMQLSDQEEIQIQIADSLATGICSDPYVLDNPYTAGETRHIESLTEYLKEGYLIASGFGSYAGQAGTNSLEAFQENYANGHRIFEADFRFSADNVLMAVSNYQTTVGVFEEERTRSALASNYVPYTSLSFEEVCDIMVEHPDIYIVADTSAYISSDMQGTVRVLDYMKKVMEEKDASLYDRLILQVYDQPMYNYLVGHYDFASYIYVMDQNEIGNEEILNFISAEKIPAVTIADGLIPVDSTLWDSFNQLGIHVFVDGVNNLNQANMLINEGVYGICTDVLTYGNFGFTPEQRYTDWEAIHAAEGAGTVEGSLFLNQNLKEMLDYLDFLCENKDNYTIFISAMDEMSRGITPEIQSKLQELGLQTDLSEKLHYSYLAAIDAGTLLYEECSDAALSKTLMLDNMVVQLKSAGYFSGNLSQIWINGSEYSAMKRGLNIVLFHTASGKVVESVAFDTYFGYQKYDGLLEE